MFAGAVAVAIAAIMGYAATVGTESNGLFPSETYGTVAYSRASEGYVTISFSQIKISPYSPPPFCSGMVVADGGAADSPFSGDYISAGVKGLTFKIKSSGVKPGSAMVVLQSSVSGRIWTYKNFEMPTEAGVWKKIVVPFNRTSGWKRWEPDLDTKWDADLRTVGLIGIRINQGGTEAQWYSIDDFMLVDENGMTSDEADLTPLEKALLARFGVLTADAVSEEGRQADSDLDGMTDLFEILSKYDILFANSIFEAQIISVTDEGATIKWACVEGAEYTVFRTSNLAGGFSLLSGGAGVDILATETGYMTFVDVDVQGPGPYYYRILKRQ